MSLPIALLAIPSYLRGRGSVNAEKKMRKISNLRSYKSPLLQDNIYLVFFCTALTKQILYRGSVSFGEFLISEDNNALIGPAIADAAHWYEKADWAGIIATPKMGFTLKSLQLYMATEEGKIPNSNFVLEKHFIESNVPLRDKSGKAIIEPEIWALAWFDEYHNNVTIDKKEQGQSEDKHHSKVWFTKDFGLCPITSGSESKYVNTAQFFMENIDKIQEVEK